jgi:hypothetical protein
VTHKNSSQEPKNSHQWNDLAQRISSVGQQISTPLGDLSNQVISFAKEVKSNNQETKGSEKEYKKRSLSWMKRSTVASSIFFFFSLILSGLTLWILSNQLRVARHDQRAWLSMFVVATEVAADKPLKFVVRVTNGGRTPAKRIDSRFIIEKVPGDYPPSFVYTDADRLHDVAVFLTSKQQRSVSEPPPLTEADMEEINTGRAYIAIFGEATYFDVYGTLHWIRFCAWHALAPGNYNAKACSGYNGVDDN